METAFNEVKTLIRQGRQFFHKIAEADLEGAFVYWKPRTGEYAVALRSDEARQKEASYRKELYRCGCLPFTVFTDSADEDSGWVLLRHPRSYSAISNFRKRAAATLDTPAKLALAGMLLGGAAGAGKALLWDPPYREYEDGTVRSRTWGEAIRDTARSALLYGGLSAAPGLIAGLLRRADTRTRYTDGTRGGYEAGWWDTFTKTPEDLEKISPSYRITRERYGAASSVKQAGILEPIRDSDVIHVDAFNRAIWNDAGYGIVDPDNALLLTSTMEAAKKGRSPFVTPGAIVGTLINAGIGYATAGVIGKTLGALNMCSPETQAQLRNIGIWGGVLNGLGNQIRY